MGGTSSIRSLKYYVSDLVTGTIKVVDGILNEVIETIKVGSVPLDIVSSKDYGIIVASDLSETVSIVKDDVLIKTLDIHNNGCLALDEIGGKLFVGIKNAVTAYDIESGTEIFIIKNLQNVKHIKLDNSKSKLFVIDDSWIRVYNAVSGDFIKDIKVGEGASFLLVNNENTIAYVSNSFDNSISVINIDDYLLIRNVKLPAFSSPRGLAAYGDIIYIANSGANNIIYYNIKTGFIFNTVQVGTAPYRLAVTPDGTKLAATNYGLDSDTISVIDLNTNGVTNIQGFNRPFDIVVVQSGEESLNEEIMVLDKDKAAISDENKIYIMTKRIYSTYEQAIPTMQSKIDIGNCLEPAMFESIKFKNGFILKDSASRVPLMDEGSYRVIFTVKIPFNITYMDSDGIKYSMEGFLEDINKDLLIELPDIDDSDFDLIVKTKCELISPPMWIDNSFLLSVNINLSIKVAGEAELLIPAIEGGFKLFKCEDYTEIKEDNLGDGLNFNNIPFPGDFFPEEFDNLLFKIED